MAENFPSLSIPPAYPIVEEREDSVIRSPFEGGYELARSRYSRIRRIFRLSYNFLPDADKQTLDTFIETVEGGADAFLWTHPLTSTTYTVRFASPPSFEYVSGAGLWHTELELREV